MSPITDIERIIEPAVEALGFELVRVSWMKGRGPTLQIMAERPNGEMTADDCAELSRSVSAILDVEDPVPEGYVLEVSSPGIDRPLVKLKDFVRFSGQMAKIETTELIEGRRRFRGKILGVERDLINIDIETGPVGLPFEQVAKARLLRSDNLIGSARK